MNVFRFNDYRDAIAEKIEESKKGPNKLSFSNLADAIRVQKTYVTKVFKKDAHFNSDQLYMACEYFKFNDEESDYLYLLLEHSRSALSKRKKELQKRISEIQMQHRDTRKHLKAEMLKPLDSDGFGRYYLDPLAPLIHTFLSIPSFAKHTKLICNKLNISEKRIKSVIKTLEELNIVKWNSTHNAYQILKDHMQLVADSPLNLPYQVFQRTNAIHKIQSQNMEERFIFSVAFSADEKTKADIHDEFLKFLRRTEAAVKSSSPTDIYQMNFDLFGWL